MRVTAKSVLAQKTHNVKITDYLDISNSSRMENIDILRNAAIDFVGDIFLDFELPSSPVFQAGIIRGMETHIPLDRANGYVTVHASFFSNNGRKIWVDLLVPYARGEFYRPSVAVVDSHKQLLSQNTIDQILANTETIVPNLNGTHFTYSRRFSRDPVVNNGVFAAPEDDVDYYDEFYERY